MKTSRRARYETYLLSNTWRLKRAKVIRRDKQCLCGSCINLVHHFNYNNLYRLPLEDLVGLCKDCHNYIHFVFPAIKKFNKDKQILALNGYIRSKSNKGKKKVLVLSKIKHLEDIVSDCSLPLLIVIHNELNSLILRLLA